MLVCFSVASVDRAICGFDAFGNGDVDCPGGRPEQQNAALLEVTGEVPEAEVCSLIHWVVMAKWRSNSVMNSFVVVLLCASKKLVMERHPMH